MFNLLFLLLAGLLFILYRRWRKTHNEKENLEAVIQSISPDVLIVVDEDRKIALCNGSINRIFGYSPDDIIGKMTDVLYLDRRSNANVKREIHDILEKQGFHLGYAKGIRKDGSLFPLEIITGNVSGREGAVILLRDITERETQERLLRESERRFRELFNSSPDPVIVEDENGTILDVNNFCCEIFGYDKDEFRKMNIFQLVPQERRHLAMNNLEKLSAGINLVINGYAVTKNARIIPTEITAATTLIDGIKAFILHLRDISARSKMR
jgi:PAS domain S-box-containing protein